MVATDHVNRSPVTAGEGIGSCKSNWHPKWMVDIGGGDKIGVAIDDGCFVVLYPHGPNQWRPGTHIPKQVAERLSQLASTKS